MGRVLALTTPRHAQVPAPEPEPARPAQEQALGKGCAFEKKPRQEGGKRDGKREEETRGLEELSEHPAGRSPQAGAKGAEGPSQRLWV